MRGGGREKRFSSKRRLGAGESTGTIRGQNLGACKTARLKTGGIQLAAFLVSRCLFASDDTWAWMTFTPCDEMLREELYRVATLIVSEHTSTSTIRAQQSPPRRSPKYVGRNISGAVSNSGRFYHTKIARRKQTEKLRGNYLDNHAQTFGCARGQVFLLGSSGAETSAACVI